MEYKVENIQKLEDSRANSRNKACLAALAAGSIVTLMSFGNFGFSLDGFDDVIRSVATLISSAGLVGILGYMVSKIAKMSEAEIDMDNIRINQELNNITTVDGERRFLVKKAKKYRSDANEKTKVIIESLAIALGIFLINKFGLYPYADNLEYGSIKELFAQFGSGVLNVFDFAALGVTVKALMDKANYTNEAENIQEYLDEQKTSQSR